MSMADKVRVSEASILKVFSKISSVLFNHHLTSIHSWNTKAKRWSTSYVNKRSSKSELAWGKATGFVYLHQRDDFQFRLQRLVAEQVKNESESNRIAFEQKKKSRLEMNNLLTEMTNLEEKLKDSEEHNEELKSKVGEAERTIAIMRHEKILKVSSTDNTHTHIYF